MEETCGMCECARWDKCKIKLLEKDIREAEGKCSGWCASRQNYQDILKQAPWYIKKAYVRCEINYNELFELMEKDFTGSRIPVNIYDAIEEIYKLDSVKLSKVLKVSVSTINYARSHGTPTKWISDFAEKLCIPRLFFIEMYSSDLNALRMCKRIFAYKNAAKFLKER